MKIVKFEVGDRLLMKKSHPCGADIFEVLRLGSDVRVKCEGCGRDVNVPRIKLEKNVKKVIPKSGQEVNLSD